MQAEFKITDSDIKYAENILLSEGNFFDDERRNFIKDYTTLDLQAVPGSGKTTALLAKLLILEKYMPFVDGSGVLVISHTNAAVDEIKNRIGSQCPKLFSYPNFVGTIQSFVDTFLAKPYLLNFLGSKVSLIDKEKYESELYKKFLMIQWDEKYGKLSKFFWGRHIQQAKKEASKDGCNANERCKRLIEHEVKDLYFDFTDVKIKLFRNNKTILRDKQNKKYIGLKKIIFTVIKNGIISFDYAFNLAEKYIQDQEKIKLFIQKRFKMVFVDEMQDMAKHQYDILDKIFYDNGNSMSDYQRIGDINQAIYSSEDYTGNVWVPRSPKIITGSHRLTPENANIVKHFAPNKINIEGRRNNKSNIKPHIIIYDDDTIKDTIPLFARLIKEFQAEGKIPDNQNSTFKAIAWRKEHPDNENIGLKDYCNNFDEIHCSPKPAKPTLYSYLAVGKDGNSFKQRRKNIIDALLEVLRLENIKTNKDRYFTKQSLEKFIKEEKSESYEQCKLVLFKLSRALIQGKRDIVYKWLRKNIKFFTQLISGSNNINNSMNFLCDIEPIKDDISENDRKSNILSYNDVDIEVGTIHSAKGQTHTATLYLESFFQNDGNKKNPISYESQRLAQQFLGKDLNKSLNKRVIQSARMAYVGLSRPTHLLCFAVHKNRFEEYISKLEENDNWIIKRCF